ncbi:MAG TPA: hypothetical protein VF857_00860, partial [Spirochaetota bacterium]
VATVEFVTTSGVRRTVTFSLSDDRFGIEFPAGSDVIGLYDDSSGSAFFPLEVGLRCDRTR